MSRSARMFEIIQLLRSAGKPMTAQTIAEQLEVTKRTVYRDIVTLQSMRVPIDGEAGIGYIMRPGFDLPPLMFTSEEVETIALGLALLGRTGDTALKQSADSVVRKISDVLPRAEKAGLANSTVFASEWHSIPPSEIDPQLLRDAVRRQVKLDIRYKDEQGDASARVILPLAVVYYVDAVILAAWCELREDFRHFRIDRISECTVTDDDFSETSDGLRRQWRDVHNIS